MEEFITTTETYGKSCINREMFDDCFESPIDMSGVSNEDMERIASTVEETVRKNYPKIADEMFRIWIKDTQTDDDIDFLAIDCHEAWEFYWEALKATAIQYGGVLSEEEK